MYSVAVLPPCLHRRQCALDCAPSPPVPEAIHFCVLHRASEPAHFLFVVCFYRTATVMCTGVWSGPLEPKHTVPKLWRFFLSPRRCFFLWISYVSIGQWGLSSYFGQSHGHICAENKLPSTRACAVEARDAVEGNGDTQPPALGLLLPLSCISEHSSLVVFSPTQDHYWADC